FFFYQLTLPHGNGAISAKTRLYSHLFSPPRAAAPALRRCGPACLPAILFPAAGTAPALQSGCAAPSGPPAPPASPRLAVLTAPLWLRAAAGLPRNLHLPLYERAMFLLP